MELQERSLFMKNAKFIFFALILFLIFGSIGCGGGGNSSQKNETDEAVVAILEKIFTANSDGSPAIFDYAPQTESYDINAKADPQKVYFLKYISSKDLNADNEFLKTINLTANCEYVIKYSHGGRILNASTLGLRVTAPDKREMTLDFLRLGAPEVSEEEAEIQAIVDSGVITREELEHELELDRAAQERETTEPLYVDADFEVIPKENPCVILYRFTAPQTGDYQFAISELIFDENSGVTVPSASFDVPFEFRLYGIDEAHSVFDDVADDLEISREDIIDIQRILIESATKFNSNGLPIDFYDDDEDDEDTASLAFFIMDFDPPKKPVEQIKPKLTKGYTIKDNKVIPPAVIDNVPYDDLFAEGTGFYAHSGLRAVTNVVDDEAFSKNAVQNFDMPKPGTGSAVKLKENLAIDVIATEKERERATQLEGMSNFTLLRDAFDRSPRKDYARLGNDATRIISVRYELAEESPRMPDVKEFKLLSIALDDLKKDGAAAFLKEYGDYFVAGYTWGLRYDATIEITADPSKSTHAVKDIYGRTVGDSDAKMICDKASEYVKAALGNAKTNAISERDTGRSSQNALDEMEKNLKSLENDFRDLSIRATHCKRSGISGESSYTVREFANSLAAFIKSSRSVNRSQYEQLRVTLRRFREIEDAKQYIPEALTVPADLYMGIRELTEKVFRTRCYYNALMAIPQRQLKNGKTLQDSWEQEFQVDLVSKVDKGLNYVCADKTRVKEYHDKFDKLYKKYKALAERYNFYCYFMRQQKSIGNSPKWETSKDNEDVFIQVGFFPRDYTRSEIVREDMCALKGDYLRYQEPCTSGKRWARFNNSYTDRRVRYFETGCKNTNTSTGTDMQGSTIGKKSYDWHYTQKEASRRLEVFLNVEFVYMPDENYPFVGLD